MPSVAVGNYALSERLADRNQFLKSAMQQIIPTKINEVPAAKGFAILAASCFLTVICLLGTLGCQNGRIAARNLPPEYRAQSGVGRQRIELLGLSNLGTASTAIGASDLLEISLTSGMPGEENVPQLHRVDRNGQIDLPAVGLVGVAGLDADAAAERIRNTAIERSIFRHPQVNVMVEEQATYSVTVLGSVAEPGVHEVSRSNCDIISAIASAGGFNDEAGTVVEVLRYGNTNYAANTPMPNMGADLASEAASSEPSADDGVKQVAFAAPPISGPVRTETIDLADMASKSATHQSLGDRDVIVVRPRQKKVVHVSGLVENPNQFELTEDHDLRVLDAIAMAGGTTSQVADKVIVIRQPIGFPGPIVAEISLSEAKRNGAENLILQPGDLVSVETTVSTVVIGTFQDLFRITMGVGGNLSLF